MEKLNILRYCLSNFQSCSGNYWSGIILPIYIITSLACLVQSVMSRNFRVWHFFPLMLIPFVILQCLFITWHLPCNLYVSLAHMECGWMYYCGAAWHPLLLDVTILTSGTTLYAWCHKVTVVVNCHDIYKFWLVFVYIEKGKQSTCALVILSFHRDHVSFILQHHKHKQFL